MSYDFAVLLPELVGSLEDADILYRGIREELTLPAAPRCDETVTELKAASEFAHEVEDSVVTAARDADARGTVVCTSWQSVDRTSRILLEVTHSRGLMLYDPQRSRLYDPRGHIRGVDVELVTAPRFRI